MGGMRVVGMGDSLLGVCLGWLRMGEGWGLRKMCCEWILWLVKCWRWMWGKLGNGGWMVMKEKWMGLIWIGLIR